MSARIHKYSPGNWDTLGVSAGPDGTNFCIFSRLAERLELLLFEGPDSEKPFQAIELDAATHRTFFYWHVLVHEDLAGVYYCWRVHGPSGAPPPGHYMEPGKALLDPRVKTVDDRLWDRARACKPGDNTASAMRGLVTPEAYDWGGDPRPHGTITEAVIYEMHVGGFTRHPSSGVANPGTFDGVVEKIPYLRKLGVTHVELMPVMAFDTQDVAAGTAALGLENYWGYSTHSFYAPHPAYATNPARARDEFRDMVRALHEAGIGVILDVVLNHTAEGGIDGPVMNFKGLVNDIFYHLEHSDPARYRDYTGCGNTVNANHPLVTRFLIGCLHYWAHDMHVDGFRFDLASALARGEDGNPSRHSMFVWATELSPLLGRIQIIAEAWDAAGLYQVGEFPGFRWAEWNGRYRDVIRRFVRGDRGLIGEVATRITGSSDLYEKDARLPSNSINFVTCHDGFTLHDLVSYNEKHNEANGEQNRDGSNDNCSWNCGAEGHTDDPGINELRRRQARNVLSMLLLSQGVPMLLSGDEVLRSQGGNNNAYCQNNEVSWLDWGLIERNRDMLAFTRRMIAFRRGNPVLSQPRFLRGERAAGAVLPDVSWHGVGLNQPRWSDFDSQQLAFTLGGRREDESSLHVMFNMGSDDVTFAVPIVPEITWNLAVDTARSPWMFDHESDAVAVENSYAASSRSVVVLRGVRPATTHRQL